jgi:S-DNA-T family DNA segregation ATPase FtsK/SpoIIIE
MASFIKVEEGPIVRTYFYEPHPSTTLGNVFSKDEDLALALGAESVMIARELGNITIAVPRKDRETIRFDECLYKLFSSPESRSLALPILMGKTMKGESLYMDLAEQPHLLIGGATGSGKSIFTSQAICSLALSHSPQELEFILTDTKQLDLVLFKKLDHVSKVIMDIHELRAELEDLIAEVRIRTATMSGVARNIKEWNASKGLSFSNNCYGILKYKVLVIDEFADVVGSDREWLNTLPKKGRPESIETLTQRLAQISRAAGIHIILATQRPSVKVISGEIKTNFPARIAFKLPSMQDSRVILDENGAEKLLGKGDYLYKVSGSDVVKRAHSAFVEMEDITLILEQHEMLRQQFSQI